MTLAQCCSHWLWRNPGFDSDLRNLDIFDEYSRDGVYSSESPVARPVCEDKSQAAVTQQRHVRVEVARENGCCLGMRAQPCEGEARMRHYVQDSTMSIRVSLFPNKHRSCTS